MLLVLALIALMLSEFAVSWITDLFSNQFTRKHLKGILTFQNLPGVQTFQQRSPRHNIEYFVPVWWLENELTGHFRPSVLSSKLGKVADELWIEHLDIQCEVEKNALGKEGRQCNKRKQFKA
jgi:hypothetical protein